MSKKNAPVLPPAYIDGQHLLSIEGYRLCWAWEVTCGENVLGFRWSRYKTAGISGHGGGSRKAYPTVQAALEAAAKSMRYTIVAK